MNDCCTDISTVGSNDNTIINGSFLVWQRGKEFSRDLHKAQPQYTADRWFEDFSLSPPAEPSIIASYHALKKGVKHTHFNPAAMVVPPLTDSDEVPQELPDYITTYAQVQGTLMTATRNTFGGTTSYTVTDQGR